LAGEFCVSGPTAARLAAADVWETNVARFGVNAWIALYAITEHLRLAQVDLGYRGPSGGEPAMPGDLRFIHTVGTLFRALMVNRRSWMQGMGSVPAPFRGLRAVDRRMEGEEDIAPLLAAFREGGREFATDWQGILAAETLKRVLDLQSASDELLSFPIDLWVRVIYEFATVFNKGEGDPDKVVEALLPLYYGRAAVYAREVSQMSLYERDRAVQGFCAAFDAQREYFRQMWETYQEWEDDVTHYWTS